MPTVTDLAPLGSYPRLRLETEEAVAEILPTRGALVTRFAVGGDELLFLDKSTVVDPSKNVRGGIPVLWPFAGKLPDDAYELDGRRFSMKQHGFARNLPWEVIERRADAEGAHVTLRLRDSEATRSLFPWAFEARLDVRLQKSDLRLALEVENRESRPLPHAPGFHPYFRVLDAEKERAEVVTDATWALDNRTGKPVALGAPDFTVDELDWHLQDHALPGTLLKRPPLRPIRLTWAEGFEALVLWTLKGRDFLCVEPWAAVAGAFPAGEGVRTVLPGETDRLEWTIGV